jgi:hypothetical protein
MGGSIGGMIAAGYLSKYFKRITIIELDDVLNDTLMKNTSDKIFDYRCCLESPTSLGRSDVPQIYQLHLLIGEGYKILQEIFPDIENKLITVYNNRNYSLKTESQITINGVLLNQDLKWFDIDRFTLETFFTKRIIFKI